MTDAGVQCLAALLAIRRLVTECQGFVVSIIRAQKARIFAACGSRGWRRASCPGRVGSEQPENGHVWPGVEPEYCKADLPQISKSSLHNCYSRETGGLGA